MTSKINDINPEEYYSASEIVKNGWLWMNTVLTFTTFLNTEEGRRLFKPIIIERGAVKRYQIKGSSIIEVLAEIEKGELHINHE